MTISTRREVAVGIEPPIKSILAHFRTMTHSTESEVFEEYAKKKQDGVEISPIVAFHPDREYVLADGFHRYNTLKRVGITKKILYLPGSVDILLPYFRNMLAEPIPDLSLVAREHLCNVTDRHSMRLVQANRIQPHLPGGSEVGGIFVLHLSCSEMRAERLYWPPGPSHIRPTKDFDLVGEQGPFLDLSDFVLGMRFNNMSVIQNIGST